MYISVTMLSSYLYCGRKLFLERVLGLFEPDKEALVKGTIRHLTYEAINKIEEKIIKSFTEKIKFKEIKDKYIHIYAGLLRDIIKRHKKRLNNVNLDSLEAFKNIFPRFVKESESRAINIYNFMNKYKIYGEELWEKLTPKIISEFKIKSDNLLLSGIVDQIEEYKEDFVPIELKTGRVPKEGVWPGHRIQIAAYALLLEESRGTKIKEGFVHYLDIDERRQVVINPFLKEEVIELREKVLELLNSDKIPEHCDNERKCAVCGLKKECFNEGFLNKKLKEKIK
ncbi:CRISPR-associated protein Cas4 [Candidatus Woesearchaeota archaeon]|nr:CRISPR-associated protein Cas4 [Candidatus Woesearchaeota archaeon]